LHIANLRNYRNVLTTAITILVHVMFFSSFVEPSNQ